MDSIELETAKFCPQLMGFKKDKVNVSFPFYGMSLQNLSTGKKYQSFKVDPNKITYIEREDIGKFKLHQKAISICEAKNIIRRNLSMNLSHQDERKERFYELFEKVSHV